MFEVKDGSRTLQFSGKKLGSSSSWKPNAVRWIEFSLYKTDNGSYILSRVGVSMVFHVASCPLVRRYGLQEIQTNQLKTGSVPCSECRPTLMAPYIFPEKIRNWAQVSEEPEAVLEALYKYDENNARYLTYVAQRLLEDASQVDAGIDAVYRVELIP